MSGLAGLSQRFLCPVGPGQKFVGLSRPVPCPSLVQQKGLSFSALKIHQFNTSIQQKCVTSTQLRQFRTTKV